MITIALELKGNNTNVKFVEGLKKSDQEENFEEVEAKIEAIEIRLNTIRGGKQEEQPFYDFLPFMTEIR